MRAADPRAAAAAFVAAGAVPDDPGAAHRIPLVKICGVVDDAGLDAALAARRRRDRPQLRGRARPAR